MTACYIRFTHHWTIKFGISRAVHFYRCRWTASSLQNQRKRCRETCRSACALPSARSPWLTPQSQFQCDRWSVMPGEWCFELRGVVKLWSSFVGSLSCLLGCHRGSCRNVCIHYGFIFHLSCSDLSKQNRKLETKVSHGEQGSCRVPLWTLEQCIHLTTNVLFIVFVTNN